MDIPGRTQRIAHRRIHGHYLMEKRRDQGQARDESVQAGRRMAGRRPSAEPPTAARPPPWASSAMLPLAGKEFPVSRQPASCPPQTLNVGQAVKDRLQRATCDGSAHHAIVGPCLLMLPPLMLRPPGVGAATADPQ